MSTFGIYKIIFNCGETEKVYIGSTTVSFVERWRKHLRRLEANTHENEHMQRLYLKYGAPRFEVVEVFSSSDGIREREQQYIDLIDKDTKINMANALPYIPMPEEIRNKIAMSKKGQAIPPEIRKKISESEKGKEIPQELRDLWSRQRTGVPKSIEHRSKISLAHQGMSPTPEALAKMRGRKVSEESKKRMSAAAKQRWIDRRTRGAQAQPSLLEAE